MGLVGVELLMSIEDRFGIYITDQEAIQVQTVLDMHQLIAHKLHPPQSDVCLSSHTFYQTRKALMTLFDTPRPAVTLDALVAELIPRRKRRDEWQRFGDVLALTLPSLEAPRWLQWIRALVFMAASFIVFLPLVYAFDNPVWLGIPCSIILAVMGGTITWAFAAWMTEPFETVIPRTCGTVRDLVLRLIVINHGEDKPVKPSSSADEWTDKRIWQVLVKTITEECNVPAQHITPYAHLWRDICQD